MKKNKDSKIPWIGEIPEDWLVRPVKSAFDKKNEKAQQDNPIILSLARAGIKVRDITNNEGQLAESYYNYNPVSCGDLLINPMDLYSGANCNVSEIEGVISPAYVNLRARDGYDPKFYDFYFKTQYWSMAFFAHGFGVSYENRWTLNNETLKNYKIPVPTYEEQVKLRKYLDVKLAYIDNIIEKTKESIEEYKKYKQSLITETVTKGLNPDVKMKDSGIEWIGEIPEHWDVRKLKHLAKLQTGKTPSTAISKYFNGDVKWFKPGDFNSDLTLIDSEDKLSQLAIDENIISIIPANSIYFVGIGATVGKMGFSKEEAFCNQQVTALIPQIVDHMYLLYLMQSANKYIQDNALYTTLPIINNGYLGNLNFILPPLDEQNSIIAQLKIKSEVIESLIYNKESIVLELESYKKSLIYEVVTGKREIN